MADYQKMYTLLFNAVTENIRKLQQAQQNAEDIYIEAPVPALKLLNFNENNVIIKNDKSNILTVKGDTTMRSFYICKRCGNLVGAIHESGAPLICCGEPMGKLVPNTVDAAHEKHVPVADRSGPQLSVRVGGAPHPMTEEHHISWIALAEGDHTQRIKLKPTGAPEAVFCVPGGGAVSVYAYCNLHGLWEVDA